MIRIRACSAQTFPAAESGGDEGDRGGGADLATGGVEPARAGGALERAGGALERAGGGDEARGRRREVLSLSAPLELDLTLAFAALAFFGLGAAREPGVRFAMMSASAGARDDALGAIIAGCCSAP